MKRCKYASSNEEKKQYNKLYESEPRNKTRLLKPNIVIMKTCWNLSTKKEKEQSCKLQVNELWNETKLLKGKHSKHEKVLKSM